MTRDGETPSKNPHAGSGETDFDRRLDAARGRYGQGRETADAPSARADGSSLGRAMRLSSEFIGGIVVGAGLGWLVDYFLGTSPWGFIILLLLGFAAGVFNVMRASGFLGSASGPRGGRTD